MGARIAAGEGWCFMATGTGEGIRLHAADERVRDRRNEHEDDRATLAITLGTLGSYLDRHGFSRAGLVVMFDEATLTIAGHGAAARGNWTTHALPIADLTAAAKRRGGLLHFLRLARLAPDLRALGALLDEHRYLRRGLTLQFGQETILVSGIALSSGAVTTAYGHETTLTLMLGESDLAAYRTEG